MLSRVAERMYWLGRYNERAENTARLVSVNANLLLDLPKMVKHIWSDLINITSGSDVFYQRFSRTDERNVAKFMLADENNPASLIRSVRMARENARVTREIIPTEVWEKINELNLYVRKNVDKALKRDGRHRFLNEVIMYCNQLTGLLYGNMSHGNAYNFIRIGANLERADMTTRILDVGCINLMQEHEEIPDSYDNILWMNVLRSLSAYQAYRQNVLDRVNGEDVADFLLKDDDFPRSVAHSLAELEKCFSDLPRNDLPLRAITHGQRVIQELNVNELLRTNRLHDFIDGLQVKMADVHTQVASTWFGYSDEPPELARAN